MVVNKALGYAQLMIPCGYYIMRQRLHCVGPLAISYHLSFNVRIICSLLVTFFFQPFIVNKCEAASENITVGCNRDCMYIPTAQILES